MRAGLGIARVETPEYCADPSYAEMFPECAGVLPTVARTGGPDIYIPGGETAQQLLLRLALNPNAPVPTNVALQPTGYPTSATNYTPYIIGGAVLLLLVMMGRR